MAFKFVLMKDKERIKVQIGSCCFFSMTLNQSATSQAIYIFTFENYYMDMKIVNCDLNSEKVGQVLWTSIFFFIEVNKEKIFLVNSLYLVNVLTL